MALEQNALNYTGKVFVPVAASGGCRGCAFDRLVEGCRKVHCTPIHRADRRDVIWVEREETPTAEELPQDQAWFKAGGWKLDATDRLQRFSTKMVQYLYAGDTEASGVAEQHACHVPEGIWAWREKPQFLSGLQAAPKDPVRDDPAAVHRPKTPTTAPAKAHPDDIIIWPDDYWCNRSELAGHNHRSDDYRVLYADSPEWLSFVEQIDEQPTPDGWTANTTGKVPCGLGDKVEVVLRDDTLLTGRADSFDWRFEITPTNGDIVRYRVVQEKPLEYLEHAAQLPEMKIILPEDSKPTNPKDSIGIRKAPLSCVPMNVVAEIGVGMLEGAAKYGRHNFRAIGVRGSVYFDAAQRHLIAWWEGEDIDPDSGLSHVTKALACLTVMRDAMLQGKFTDDRPPKSPPFYAELNERAGQILDRHVDKSPKHYTEAQQ